MGRSSTSRMEKPSISFQLPNHQGIESFQLPNHQNIESFHLLNHLDFDKIRGLIECKQCHDCSEKSVKILPCKHSFCGDCLQNYCREKQKGIYAPCPCCDQMFEIPHGGCANLCTNEFAQMAKSIFYGRKRVLWEDFGVSDHAFQESSLDLQGVQNNIKQLKENSESQAFGKENVLNKLDDDHCCAFESPEILGDCPGSRICSSYEKKLLLSHEEDSVTSEPISMQNASVKENNVSQGKQFSVCEIGDDIEQSCNLEDLQGREIYGSDESKTRKNVEIGDFYVKFLQEMALCEKEHTCNDTLSEGNYTDDAKLGFTDDEKLGMKGDVANTSSLNEDDEKENIVLFNATDDDKLSVPVCNFMCAFQKDDTYDRKHKGLKEFRDNRRSNETWEDKAPVAGNKIENEISGTLVSSNCSGVPLMVFGNGNEIGSSESQPSTSEQADGSSGSEYGFSNSVQASGGAKSNGDGGEDNEKRDRNRYFSNEKKGKQKVKTEDEANNEEKEEDDDEVNIMAAAADDDDDDSVIPETVSYILSKSNNANDDSMYNQNTASLDSLKVSDTMKVSELGKFDDSKTNEHTRHQKFASNGSFSHGLPELYLQPNDKSESQMFGNADSGMAVGYDSESNWDSFSPGGNEVNKMPVGSRQYNRYEGVTPEHNECRYESSQFGEETDVKQLQQHSIDDGTYFMGRSVHESIHRNHTTDFGAGDSAHGDAPDNGTHGGVDVIHGQITAETNNLDGYRPVPAHSRNHIMHNYSHTVRGHQINIVAGNPSLVTGCSPSAFDFSVNMVTAVDSCDDPYVNPNFDVNGFGNKYPTQVSQPELTLETYNRSAWRLSDEAFQRIITNAISSSGDPVQDLHVSIIDDVVIETTEINVLRYDI